jgi:CheY-like chemotaxis protein
VDNIVKPMCVLVIEDEWLVRQLIAEHLRQAGCTVVEATTGEEALAFLNGVQPPIDILFTDIQLGGRLSGWDVADAFRKSRPQIPVVYTSGQPRREHRSVSGAVFFDKPYLPDDILDACKALSARSPREQFDAEN